MKAVIIREPGGPDKLIYEEVDTPSPGAGEVLVRICAAGVDHLDYDIREGIARFSTLVPHVPGIEGAGEVAEIGPDVTSVPCQAVSGLPLGLMLTRRWMDDATVLRAANSYMTE